ncbi:hypothetical protein A0H81_01802 [Grifola frondosa]|uniref:Uncharacterized protein n=1 Tax=Grifola frondosa TaxID=5627 RepID=A0A1C7MM29_GRIFR|nr:hypothetical protein A0H81_01802 [Grifola frondosa]
MLFKCFVLAAVALLPAVSAWQVMLYENGSGGDAQDCSSGGTTVEGSGSDCITPLTGINVESAEALSSDGCTFTIFSNTGCSGNSLATAEQGACLIGIPGVINPINSVGVSC